MTKRFAWGLAAGFVLTLLLELAGVLIFIQVYKKSPSDIAALMQAPPLPESLDADFALDLLDSSGEIVSLADFSGQPIVLTFMKPTCGSCEAELPALQKLHTALEGSDVQMIVVSIDNAPEKLEELAAVYALGFPFYRSTAERPKQYDGAVPKTFVITKEGKIAFRHVGAADWSAPEAVAYLKGLSMFSAESEEG